MMFWRPTPPSPVLIGTVLKGYQCRRCEVWGKGDRCWSCGTEKVDFSSSYASMDNAGTGMGVRDAAVAN